MNSLKGKIIAILVVIIVAAGAYIAGAQISGAKQASAAPVVSNNAGKLIDATQSSVTSIYNAASPAVVEIDTTQQASGFFGDSLEQGLGSGIVVDNNGDILTNNHVVSGSTSVTVKFINGNTVTGQVLGTDAIKDLAVVKVDASAVSGITPLTFGDSSQLTPGETAIAIGNPYGLDDSISIGIISGINRSLDNMTGLVQTDASLNPGNSGGPLLDSNGNVIGINDAIETSATGGTTGIGFAVPSNAAVSELPGLEAGKTISHPWIGISGETLTAALANQFGINVNQGIYVASVVSGSPADKAGLKGSNFDANGLPTGGGDVITAADGNAVNTIESLQTYVAGKNVGDTISLTVIRNGNTMTVQVTLAAMPANLNSSNGNQTPQIPTPGNGGHGYRSYQTPGNNNSN